MSRAETAQETLRIIADGKYTNPIGEVVEVGSAIKRAAECTQLFTPERLAELEIPSGSCTGRTLIEVTSETTAQAGRRLTTTENGDRVVALNFASAKNPGGGFIGGAKAQEEDLALCSALYACLVKQPKYYEANRHHDSLLYTDHIIYSPDVPFFRGDDLNLLEAPFPLSIITAPAPNAGELLRRDPDASSKITEALERRARYVLNVAAHQNHRTIVLGAWGCGVFRNSPEEVASIFHTLLKSDLYSGMFERVVFPVYDTSKQQRTLSAFVEEFKAVTQ